MRGPPSARGDAGQVFVAPFGTLRGVVRRRSKISCRAEVVLTGFDVQDIGTADPVAIVTINAPDDAERLARFMGMCVVAMLRIAHYTPEITMPFASVGARVVDAIVDAPSDVDLSGFSIADGVRPADVGAVVEHETLMAEATGQPLTMETMLTIAFPRVGGKPRRGKKRRLRAELHEGLSPFVSLPSRNASIAADGVLCMLEQITHEQPREVAQHVARVCQRLLMTHGEICGMETPLTFDQATAMYRLAERLAQADDPSAISTTPNDFL